jgi:hypothetical protein
MSGALPNLMWGDFCPVNCWQERPDLGVWEDVSQPRARWIEDKTTGRLYLNMPGPAQWCHAVWSLAGSAVVQPFLMVGYSFSRLGGLLGLGKGCCAQAPRFRCYMASPAKTCCADEPLTWSSCLSAVGRVVATPFAWGGLVLADGIGAATFGLLTQDMRKVHTSIERAYYGGGSAEIQYESVVANKLLPRITLTPCFAPATDANPSNMALHLISGPSSSASAI